MDFVLEKATRQHTKGHNSRLVLRGIYDAGEISRADLARATRLTRTTVSEIVGDLITQGLVDEVGHGSVEVGRTPTLLSVVEDSRQIVAVDINNTEIQGALVNLRGAIRKQARLPLTGQDGDTVLELLFPLIDSLVKAANSPLLGIGISSPGLIDTATGTLRRAVNFNWHDLPLRTMVQARHDFPVCIAHDADTVVLAEYMFGSSPQPANLVAIKVGRGIGAGIMLNGQLFSSDTFGAGEIGHVVVEPDGPLCVCGNRGCLETVANTTAIVRRAQQFAHAHPDGLLRQLAPSDAALTLDTVIEAFHAGDADAKQIIIEIGRYLAISVAHLIAILGIRRVVITGRVAHFGPFLRDVIAEQVHHRVLPELAEATTIEVLEQKPETVLLGAAALLLTSELGLARLARRYTPEDEAGK